MSTELLLKEPKTLAASSIQEFIFWVLVSVTLICIIALCILHIYKEVQQIIQNKDKLQKSQEAYMLDEEITTEVAERYGISEASFDVLRDEELEFLSTIVIPTEITLSFSDIGGLNDQIQSLKEALLPIYYKNLATPALSPNNTGVILHGHDGCGRALLVKALAHEAKLAILHLKPSDIISDYGYSITKIRLFFSFARKIIKKPYIIFLDNIPFIEALEWYDEYPTEKDLLRHVFLQTLDDLLNERDIIPVASIPEKAHIDELLLSRMPVKIMVGLPDQEARKQIFEAILKDEMIDPKIDLKRAALETETFTGSEVKSVCRFASLKRLSELATSVEFDQTLYRDISTLYLRPITTEDIMNGISKVRKNHNKPSIPLMFA